MREDMKQPPEARLLIALPLLIMVISACPGRAENWPQWRGPFLNGSTTETSLPVKWSRTEGLAWVTTMPGPSGATPIVWGDRVFVSSADSSTGSLLALCVDAKTGKILWSKRTGKNRTPLTGKKQNMASPSAATDGKSVYFFYGTGDLAAFDYSGNLLWARALEKDYGTFIIKWGYGGSPLLYRGKLYIVVMQNKNPRRYGGSDPRKGPLDSFLLGIDAKTGKTLWKQVRPADAEDESTESYTTPTLYERDGRGQIILYGGEYVTGHDPATGKESWRWEFSPRDRKIWQRTVAPATAGDGMIYVGRARSRGLYALKPRGAGRLGDDIVAWKHSQNANDVTGPLLYGRRLYLLDGVKKVMTCLEPKTGKVFWHGKLKAKGEFRASPTGADGKIYCMSMSGEVVVLAAGDTFKHLAAIEMKEKTCYSTVSAAGGRLFIRTPRYLYCVGAPVRQEGK